MERKNQIMNIYAKRGTKVWFLNENGYEFEREQACKVLTTDREYTVIRTEVFDSSSKVFLEGFVEGFNTVMFTELPAKRSEPSESPVAQPTTMAEAISGNHCPACFMGQNAEAGQGTHREGTVEHPVSPPARVELPPLDVMEEDERFGLTLQGQLGCRERQLLAALSELATLKSNPTFAEIASQHYWLSAQLPDGKYRVVHDGQEVGVWSAEEIAVGMTERDALRAVKE